MSNVTVNLSVSATASGEISIFGKEIETISNIVVADVPLPLSVFYRSSEPEDGVATDSGLWRFKQPAPVEGEENSDAANERIAEVEKAEGGLTPEYESYTSSASGMPIVEALHACVTGELNTVHVVEDVTPDAVAEPFNAPQYDGANSTAYRTYASIGDLALALAAHEIFGHVQATAAIDNDTEFVDKMNSKDTYADHATSTSGFANIANKLAAAIAAMSDEEALAVVEQVIGQDAERAKDVDNSEVTPDKWQYLQWKAGDVIFVQIKLQAPDIVRGTDQKFNPEVTYEQGANEYYTYNIKITLSAAAGDEEEEPEVPGGGGSTPSGRTVNFTTTPYTALLDQDNLTVIPRPVPVGSGSITFTGGNPGQALILFTGPTPQPVVLDANGSYVAASTVTGYILN